MTHDSGDWLKPAEGMDNKTMQVIVQHLRGGAASARLDDLDRDPVSMYADEIRVMYTV